MSSQESNNRRPRSWRHIVREIGSTLLLIVGIMAARSAIADHYYVPSGSMEPTLLAGDRIVVDKRAYGFRLPFTPLQLTGGERVDRGDVVIFDSPRDGKRLVKRIVAIGGDTVAISDGHLLINGRSQAVSREYGTERIGNRIVHLNLTDGGGPDYLRTIPAGKLLAVGDHRGNSLDGRMFGLIDEDAVYGKAKAVYFRDGDGFTWKVL